MSSSVGRITVGSVVGMGSGSGFGKQTANGVDHRSRSGPAHMLAIAVTPKIRTAKSIAMTATMHPMIRFDTK